MSLAIVLQALYILVMPAVVLVAVARIKPLSFLGPVLLCYGVGMILANVPGIPVDEGVSRPLHRLPATAEARVDQRSQQEPNADPQAEVELQI